MELDSIEIKEIEFSKIISKENKLNLLFENSRTNEIHLRSVVSNQNQFAFTKKLSFGDYSKITNLSYCNNEEWFIQTFDSLIHFRPDNIWSLPLKNMALDNSFNINIHLIENKLLHPVSTCLNSDSSQIYFSYVYKKSGSDINIDSLGPILSLNKDNLKVYFLGAEFPNDIDEYKQFEKLGLNVIMPQLLFWDNYLIYNYPYSNKVYRFDLSKNKTNEIIVPSKNSKPKITPLNKNPDFGQIIDHLNTEVAYGAIQYWNKFNVFIRIHRHQRSTSQEEAKYYLMIVDSEFRPILESLLPQNIIPHPMIVVENLYFVKKIPEQPTSLEVLEYTLK